MELIKGFKRINVLNADIVFVTENFHLIMIYG